MDKEKQKSMKVKIMSLVASIVICFLLIGVSVYAALTQTLTINNNITITTSGQTKVAVTVSEYLNKAKTAVSDSPTSISDWVQLINKADSTNSVSMNNDTEVGGEIKNKLSPINFDLKTSVNYYAYKFTFTDNSDLSDGLKTYAHITATEVSNGQLDIYYGETLMSGMTKASSTAINDITIELEKSIGKDFYIIVASNTNLEYLEEMASTPFNITITIDQEAQ